MWGYESPCPQWLRLKYRQRCCFVCEQCKRHEKEVGKLEIHRLKRGCDGGLYSVCQINHPENNVKIVCNKCHKMYHQNEN